MNNPSAYGNEGCGYMDGEYLPMSEMSLPVTDLGFQLSDMCYDALHVHNGRYFRMDDHLDRLAELTAEAIQQTPATSSRSKQATTA